MSKKTDYKKMSDADIAKAHTEAKKTLMEFRFGTSSRQTKNVKEPKMIKKNVARMMTEMTARKNNAIKSASVSVPTTNYKLKTTN